MIGKSSVKASAWEDTKLPFLFPWKWYVSSAVTFYAWVARTRQTKQTKPETVQVVFLKTESFGFLFPIKWRNYYIRNGLHGGWKPRDLELITLFQNITIPWHAIHEVFLCYVLLFTKAGCYQNVLFVLLLWIILLYKFSPQLREHCSINPLLCFNWLSFSLSN